MLVRKNDGTWRFCLDYRKLNAVTVKDSHPLPRVDDALDALAGAAWFSTIDLQHGYWQVELAEQDREKTAFTTGTGLYHFKVMPMGLTNAPATFQRLMEMVLRGLPWKTCLVYLDDVLIFSRTFDEHLKHLEEVFTRFQGSGLKLNPAKCSLARDHVRFLGHVVSKHGIQPDPKNVESVRDWPTPHTPTEVRAFLGLCSYYRKFIRDFAHHAAPLHALTEKNAPFQWTSQCQDAFNFLQHALSNPPVVSFPDFALPFYLHTDASCSAIGAVLAQKHGQHDTVVAYASHVLTKAERKWSTYDRELWAIVWAVRHFRHYLYKQPFIIITDHKPLVGLRKIPIDSDRTGRRARWALELDPFEWTVVHRTGLRHGNADALSRRPDVSRPPQLPSPSSLAAHDPSSRGFCPNQVHQVHPIRASDHNNVDPKLVPQVAPQANVTTENCTEFSLSTFVFPVSEEDLKNGQRQDSILSEVIGWKIAGRKPPYWCMKKRSTVEKAYWQDFDRLIFQNDVLCRQIYQPSPRSVLHQIILPPALQGSVLSLLHGNILAGHLSAEKVLKRAQQICYWPFMARDIREWCQKCIPCDARRSPSPQLRAPMKTIVASQPLQKVAADILELPTTGHGNRYVLVVQDYFSKYVNLYAMKDQRAVTVAECLFEKYICEHGIPESLHTDQGRQFESELIGCLCKLLGVQKTRTSPYHPQCDGMVERFNRTLIDQLAKALLQQPGEWDESLNQVALAYNTSPHSTTGYTPFYLTHGREARMPVNLLLPNSTPSDTPQVSTDDYAGQIADKLQSAFTVATQNRDQAHVKQKLYYDRRVRYVPYNPGDLVWLNDPTSMRQKLAPHWKGPFEILECLGGNDINVGVTYKIHYLLDQADKCQIVHHNRLRPYTSTASNQAYKPPEHVHDVLLQTPSPCSTALSGALPFSQPTSTRTRSPAPSAGNQDWLSRTKAPPASVGQLQLPPAQGPRTSEGPLRSQAQASPNDISCPQQAPVSPPPMTIAKAAVTVPVTKPTMTREPASPPPVPVTAPTATREQRPVKPPSYLSDYIRK